MAICKEHGWLFITSHNAVGTDGTHERWQARVCARCGRFEVFGMVQGEAFDISFTLPTQELVKAAGKYLERLGVLD